MENNSLIRPRSIIVFFINISILLISVFPIFGKYGMIIQNSVVWITIFLGIICYLCKKNLFVNKYLLLYMGYIFFSIVSILWSIKLGGAYIRIMNMIQVCLFCIVLISSCKDKFDMMKYLDMYMMGVVIVSIYCLIKDISSIKVWARLGKNEFEISGQNQIYYSCILIYSTMYAIYKAFNNKKHRLLYMIIAIFLYFCGLLTAIRKCLIVPGLFLIIYTIIANKNNLLKLIIYTIISVAIVVIAYMMIRYFPSMSYRINGLISDLHNNTEYLSYGNSFSTRGWLRELAIELFIAHPIIGVGVGQFKYYAFIEGVNLYAHNNYLEILANTGIVGFLIYYSSYFIIFKQCIKSFKQEKMQVNEINFIFAFFISTLIMEYSQVEYYQLFFIVFFCSFSYILNTKKYLVVYGKVKEIDYVKENDKEINWER